MDVPVPNDVFVFEGFQLDRRAGGLFRHDVTGGSTPVAVGSRALDVLSVLVVRHGELVSKDEIMSAVWPGTTVEEHNLTVQISALRRVLDEGRSGESCIQTVSGRGYRFVSKVTRVEAGQTDLQAGPIADAMAVPEAPARSRRARWLTAGIGGIAIASLLIVVAWHGAWFADHAALPRLSIVVLPFQNLGGDPKDDYLADGITDDLTTDLSHIPVAFVIARETAYTYKGKATDVRQIGRELGVRYVLEGSVRRVNSIVRSNVQLISAETGAHLWADRFDEQIVDLTAGQEGIVMRIGSELGVSLVEIEKARSLHERPTNPDAFDLILRARAVTNLPPNRQRNDEAQALYEQALSLDPTSVLALTMTAFFLIEQDYPGWKTAENMRRAETLLMRARAVAPDSEVLLNITVQWLRKLGRYQEGMALAEELIRKYPNNPSGYFDLAQSKTIAGHAEEAIPLEEKAIRLNPRSAWVFNRYVDIGFASLMLGRDRDAITFLEQSIAINPDDYRRQWTLRFLAAAYARTGQLPEAKHAVAEADRLWPYDTVRMHWPDDPSSSLFAEQIRRFQDALRIAGERDHADEDAEFGVPADSALHAEFAGRTPKGAQGVTTIRTTDLGPLLAEARPIVIDTVSYSWGRSIPGAVGLRNAGLGGSYNDETQDRLRHKLHELTAGDFSRPIVAVGWNSERFDGRNLALRLVALGYTQVYWYRGGREAWEVAEQAEAELALQEW